MSGMDEETNTRKVVYGILEFLDEEYKKSTTTADSRESLEVAIQCLETGFGVSLRDNQYKLSKSLRELVRTPPVASAPGGEAGEAAAAAAAATPQAAFSSLSGSSYINTGPDYVPPEETNENEKKLADELKNRGNDAMKNNQFNEALEDYNKAISLDGRNAVYFCNRAAAYIKLEQFDNALRDCQIAVQLQPTYARAYGRMGVTYSSQNNHVDAILCYKKALELEPDNESYRKNLSISQHMMLQDVPAAQAQAAASPNLQSFFSNPNLINMASQMLQDPSMQQMMQNIMSSFQANNGPGGQGNGMENLLQMGQAIAQQIQNSNPNLVDQLTQGTTPGGSGDGPQNRPNPDGENK